MNQHLKICRLCGKDKPITEYHRNNAARDGHVDTCKPCKNRRDTLRKQKTRSSRKANTTGYVYFIAAGDDVKIGVTRNIANRVHNLQVANPLRLELLGYKLLKDPYRLESEIHRQLATYRIREDGEWFRLPEELLHDILSRYDITTKTQG